MRGVFPRVYTPPTFVATPFSRILGSGACQYDISNFQPGHANSGSSESDIVSGKMKEAIIGTIVIQAQ